MMYYYIIFALIVMIVWMGHNVREVLWWFFKTKSQNPKVEQDLNFQIPNLFWKQKETSYRQPKTERRKTNLYVWRRFMICLFIIVLLLKQAMTLLFLRILTTNQEFEKSMVKKYTTTGTSRKKIIETEVHKLHSWINSKIIHQLSRYKWKSDYSKTLIGEEGGLSSPSSESSIRSFWDASFSSSRVVCRKVMIQILQPFTDLNRFK